MAKTAKTPIDREKKENEKFAQKLTQHFGRFGPHGEDTLVFLAFCSRRAQSRAHGGGLETDGTVLRDRFGVIAKWADPTRVVINAERMAEQPAVEINEKRMVGTEGPALKRFLDYWCGFYVIGVSTRPFTAEES